MSCLCGYSECSGCLWGAGGEPPGLTAGDEVSSLEGRLIAPIGSKTRHWFTRPVSTSSALERTGGRLKGAQLVACSMLRDVVSSLYEISGSGFDGSPPDLTTTIRLLGFVCETILDDLEK